MTTQNLHWFNGKTKGERLSWLFNESPLQAHISKILLYPSEELGDENSQSLKDAVIREFGSSSKLAVRSSFYGEDAQSSQAGKFLSILNVSPDDVAESIAAVLASGDNGDLGATSSERPHVIVQKMVDQVARAGVLFTANPSHQSFAATLQWSEGSATDVVTAGKDRVRTIQIPGGIHAKEIVSHPLLRPFDGLLELAVNLERLAGEPALDIEFAQDTQGHWWILQVRPIWTGNNGGSQNFLSREDESRKSSMYLAQLNSLPRGHAPYEDRGDAVLGVMPDWNPAELIGTAPNQLAMSLFKLLISDSTWAYERKNFGYRDLRGTPLILEVQGVPYVDVRTSALSLVPASLDDETAFELVAAELAYLRSHPYFHDKVEFEVFATCWTPSLEQHLSTLGLTATQRGGIEHALRSLTVGIIRSNPYGLEQSLAKFRNLKPPQMFLPQDNPRGIAANLNLWLEDGRRFGTLPFAGVARCAFIATAILRDAVECGFVEQDHLTAFYASLNFPTTQMARDLEQLDFASIVDNYGHLRPGTFDLSKPSYREEADLFLRGQVDKKNLTFSGDELVRGLQKASFLTEIGVTAHDFLNFSRESISMREWVKFEFSRNISATLDGVRHLGETLGFSPEEALAFDINDVLQILRTDEDPRSILSSSVQLGIRQMERRNRAILPALITSPEDFWAFELMKSEPNFVTQGSVRGEIAHVSYGGSQELEGKIVVAEGADPGFDWVFSRGIAGFISRFGGANSHMAIRCIEQGVPAAIGVGDELWARLQDSTIASLDCKNKTIHLT